ncbi:MAG: glycosyltransferase family protein [Desulfamplus sp.]|nr:glycosyltransferase family protein [Desulfamplus sp.]
MKITATIQARTGSSRLPGKVMKNIAGKPMLQHQLERVLRSRLIDEVVVATTTNPQDDVIVELAKKTGVKYFRGSENDVLGRIVSLLKEFEVELHVELIGDSPFTDPQIIDEIIGFYLKNRERYDYVSNGTKVTYPSGMEVNVYPAKVLIEAETKIDHDDPLREHVDIHLSKNDQYRRICLEAPSYFHFPDIYLEVDTPKDFEMVTAVFKHFFNQEKSHFSLSQILDFLAGRPDLVELNQSEERRWRVFKDG